MTQTIALDAMGGDFGPEVVVPAAVEIVRQVSGVELVLVGDQTVLQSVLEQEGAGDHPRLRCHHATQVVDMDDPPALALRNKKDSSMRVAIDLVKAGEADACVSAGNTGALMATAKFVLKTLPGISRPAICTVLPTAKGHTHMLDLGANVECSPEHLRQFALMGNELAGAVDDNPRPSVGLLNVGAEAIKGNDVVKQADGLLAEDSLNYVGFVEGDDIYQGTVDVVVCDGFVGNVALKTSEGLARMISDLLKREFNRNLFTRLAGLVALPVMKAFKKRIDPRRYNGASLLGLQGIVIKSHGSADAFSFANAIRVAILETEKGVPGRISSQLEMRLSGRESA